MRRAHGPPLEQARRARSLYRGGGSIGFVGACRSVWLLARDLHLPERRVLAQIKNNLAPPQPSLSFSFPETGTAAPALTWHGCCDATADELLGGALASVGLTGPRNRAKDFLAGLLEECPRTSRQVWEEAEAQDISERTLRRAREDTIRGYSQVSLLVIDEAARVPDDLYRASADAGRLEWPDGLHVHALRQARLLLRCLGARRRRLGAHRGPRSAHPAH
jgi:hypothetical protein